MGKSRTDVYKRQGILLLPLNSYAQFTKGLSYRAETGVSFSGGEHTPFWPVSYTHLDVYKRQH